MKKILIFIVVVAVLGVGYWLISPFFINKIVSEESPLLETTPSKNASVENTSSEIVPSPNTQTEVSTELSASGSFSGFDKVHYGSGTVSLITSADGPILRFEEDFNVANGPDLYVGFGKNGQFVKGSEISKLKGNIGSQNYVLPKDFNMSATDEIWIWCKAFSVPFAKALLVAQN